MAQQEAVSFLITGKNEQSPWAEENAFHTGLAAGTTLSDACMRPAGKWHFSHVVLRGLLRRLGGKVRTADEDIFVPLSDIYG